MSLKEIIGISLISLVLFPLLLLGVLLGTGTVHLEVGSAKEREALRESFRVSEIAKQDSAEAAQLKVFKALEARQKEAEEREASARREIERLENLKMETVREKEEILRHRRRIEELVTQSGDLQDKQIAALAEVYGSMRPDEAAPILLSLKDSLVVRILRKIPEARAASKIMASLGALDVRRAARITEMMGKSPVAPRASKSRQDKKEAPAPPTPEKTPAPAPAAPASPKAPAPDKSPAPAAGGAPA